MFEPSSFAHRPTQTHHIACCRLGHNAAQHGALCEHAQQMPVVERMQQGGSIPSYFSHYLPLERLSAIWCMYLCGLSLSMLPEDRWEPAGSACGSTGPSGRTAAGSSPAQF